MMKRLLVVFAICVMALAMPAAAFAAGGNGTGGGTGGGGGNGSGGGTGGGSEEPLTVVSASVEEGATIDPVQTITLVFSKNVCDASVREANMKLASVTDASGGTVATGVVLADDQVEPDKRNEMVIEFAEPQKPGLHTLTVQAGVTSKSGDSLAENYTLHFTIADTGSSSSAAVSSSAAPSAASSSSANATQEGPNVMFIVGVAVIVVVVIAGVVAFARKRK